MEQAAIPQASLDPEVVLAPWSLADIRTMLGGQGPRHVKGGDPRGFAALLDWDGMLDLALTGKYPAGRLNVTRGGYPVPAIFHRDGDKPNAPALERLMASGGSMILLGVDSYVPRLAQFCDALARGLDDSEKVIISAVGTTGAGGALALHFDKGDTLVMQIEGRKHWTVHGNPVPGSIPGMPPILPDPDAPKLLDLTLEPGDLLFVPAGYAHKCDNRSERSLHLTLLFYPLTAPRVIELLFRGMVKDPAGRRAFRELAGDPAALKAALREEIVTRLDGIPFDELFARHRAANFLLLREDD